MAAEPGFPLQSAPKSAGFPLQSLPQKSNEQFTMIN
jgi:hypothetical protein